jgi:hypothetical protein
MVAAPVFSCGSLHPVVLIADVPHSMIANSTLFAWSQLELCFWAAVARKAYPDKSRAELDEDKVFLGPEA